MILFVMFLLLVIPFLCGIEALFTGRDKPRGRAIFAGVCIGGFLWNAYSYLPAFVPISLALIALALALFGWVMFIMRRAMPLALTVTAAATTAAILFLGWDVLLVGYVNEETVAEVSTLNVDGNGQRALIVYHAGGSEFQQRITTTFAESLAENGWSVDVTTASSQAPTNLADYDLLVLGTPTYNWGEASRPMQQYVSRVGAFNRLPTVTITSGVGYIAHPQLDDLVVAAGGQVIRSIQIYTTAPNSERYGTDDHFEIMRRQAVEVLQEGWDQNGS